MQNRVELEPAFVLHRRPYSNSSLIVDFFTEQHGRVSAMARSARGPKSRYRGKLELFYPMLISWVGRGELKTLGNVDFFAEPLNLQGDALLCGFYLNELLVRLLERDDPYAQLFSHYHQCLRQLVLGQSIEVALRLFEKNLLQELGYGLSFKDVQPDKYYKFIPDRGFFQCEKNEAETGIFSGVSLMALHHADFSEKATLNEIKQLMRIAIGAHLGNKPLKSRDLVR